MKKSPRDDDTHKTKPTQQQTLQESKSLKEDTKTIPLKKKKKTKTKTRKNQNQNSSNRLGINKTTRNKKKPVIASQKTTKNKTRKQAGTSSNRKKGRKTTD
jgi:hypothetical protein